MSKNNNAVENHGCIVHASLINLPGMYTPDGRRVDCTMTRQHRPDEQSPPVNCNSHTGEKI